MDDTPHSCHADVREARPIVIQAGAMVADRCVLLPGVEVGRNAVLGSGTFAPPGFQVPAGSIWLGCVACVDGKPVVRCDSYFVLYTSMHNARQ